MKKIGKLSINPEKVIKNDELVNLRGGYGGDTSCSDGTTAGSSSESTWRCCHSTGSINTSKTNATDAKRVCSDSFNYIDCVCE